MDLHGGVREHPLDRLVRRDRLAELLAALAVLDRELEKMLARPHGSRREGDASDVEGSERRPESGADLATEDVRLGDLAILEDELAGVRAAQTHLLVDPPDVETLEALLDDESGDATPRAFFTIIRGVDDDDVGDGAVRHPDLAPVQDPAAIA